MMGSLAPLAASSLLELVVRATILLSAALALAWLARKGPAGVRHLLWTITFALLLGLPVVSFLGLSWEVPVFRSASMPTEQRFFEIRPIQADANGFITPPASESSLPLAGPTRQVQVGEPDLPARPIPRPLLFWAVGCAIGLTSLVLGGVRFARLVRTASPVRDPALIRQAEALRQRLGIHDDVELLVSQTTTTPMTGGLLRRVILFPASAAEWSPELWRVVLMHEMVHVRRRDVLRHLMGRTVLALYWFHPLSWVATMLAATASEEACDQEVLTLGTRPSEYAAHLLALAGSTSARRPVLTLPMSQQSHSQLERRIMAILSPFRPSRSGIGTALMVTVLGGTGVSATVVDPVQILSSDTVTAEVVAWIGGSGVGYEREEDILAKVTSVAADQEGLVYVADGTPPSVRVFSSDGEFLAWIGRRGEGPGEFSWEPVDILATADGRLIVKADRITTFSASADSEYPDSVADTWRFPGYFSTQYWRARFVDGVYYYPHYDNWADSTDHYYLKFGPTGQLVGDTARVPALGGLSRQRSSYYRVGASGGRMVYGLNIAPFAPRADWDMTQRGTIIVGDGETYQLQEFDQDGQLLRTIDGPEVERRAVPRAEYADSMRAVEARIDSLPVPLDDVFSVAPEIRRGELPDSLPGYLSLHVGASDRIWVERWPAEGMASSRFYDVLEYDGRYAGTVVAPVPLLSDPPPFFGEDTIVGVVIDPTTEVHRVVVLRFSLAK
ncbi:MAG: 6-bladed beta-propeller [Gemmatimonadota bacterium]|nr:6-bladed beta-propeller [Gemmatimonadota bacterium]